MIARIGRFKAWWREFIRVPSDEELDAEIAETRRLIDELEASLETSKENRRKIRAAAKD